MRDETDQPASRIIDAFGGIRPMAARLEVPVSTVQGWKQRDTIPAARMDAIRAAAEADGIDLATDDPAESEPSPADDSEAPRADDGQPLDELKSWGEPAAEPAPPSAPPSRGGGIAILALVVALAAGGWVWWSTLGPGAAGGDNARLSAIEGRLARLAEKTGEAGIDPAAMETLRQDVATLQTRLSELSAPDVETPLKAIRAEIGELRERLAAQAGQAGGGEAASPDPELLARLDALDGEVRNAVELAATNMQAMSGALLEFDAKIKALAEEQTSLVSRIAALEAGRSAEEVAMSRASALALAAGQLRTALERGAPFGDALATLDTLSKDDTDLAAALTVLRAQAEAGVTTGTALRVSFAKLVPELLAAGRTGSGGDLVDRLAGRLNDIVSVRRTGAGVQGDDVEARIARAEIFLADRDVAAALAEFDGLEGVAADILAPWAARARGHLDARDALAAIEAQAIARLRAEGGS